jgi:HAD superfamily hydrolase (TIGR01549 family)
MIKNIIWDVDGTLFDTYPAMTFAYSKLLKELALSMPLNEIHELVRQSLGHCERTLSQRFQVDPELLRRNFSDTYRQISLANQSPFPGAAAVCAFIRERGGLNLIVTHRGVASTRRLLQTHDLMQYFEEIISVEQGYPRKPDPAMFLAAIERFNLNGKTTAHASTLAVGDRAIDIQAGRAAGLPTCLFGMEKLAEPADYQITHYSQLLALLKEDGE